MKRIFSRVRKSAFTLIELLAAMTILSIMVLLISKVFAESTKMWQLGTKRVESNTDGRAVMDVMVREISAMLCDNQTGPLGFRLDSKHFNVMGMESDMIAFVSSDQVAEIRSSNYRQAIEVVYEVQADPNNEGRYRLVRWGVEKFDGGFTAYKPGGFPTTLFHTGFDPNWAVVLAENVRTIEFWAYDTNSQHHADYRSSAYGRPAWVDIYLEMLGEDDAIKASVMSGSAQEEYCRLHARRYVGRAYPHSNGAHQ